MPYSRRERAEKTVSSITVGMTAIGKCGRSSGTLKLAHKRRWTALRQFPAKLDSILVAALWHVFSRAGAMVRARLAFQVMAAFRFEEASAVKLATALEYFHVPITDDQWANAAKERINAHAVDHLSHLWRCFRTHEQQTRPTNVIREVTGQNPQTLEEFFRQISNSSILRISSVVAEMSLKDSASPSVCTQRLASHRRADPG